MISSPTVDLIKWWGLASLMALVALSLYVAGNVGAGYWKLLLFLALTAAGLAQGLRVYLKPPHCLECERPVPRDARDCPHCHPGGR